jgi:hypothetical protein
LKQEETLPDTRTEQRGAGHARQKMTNLWTKILWDTTFLSWVIGFWRFKK